jgi:peptidoglycan L-alanyl-D-glutamate endopeptidase CwlK
MAANLDGLNPIVRQATEELIRRCKAKGIDILITQAYRSKEEQDALYAQGRTKPGKIVTYAKGGDSYHNYGLAIDFCLLVDGKKASWDMNADLNHDKISDWMEVVAEAKKLGFAWGGDWKTFKDYSHFEMTFGLSIADLKAGKKPPTQLAQPTKPQQPQPTQVAKPQQTAKPAQPKYPLPNGILKRGDRGESVKQLQRALNAAGFKCGEVDGDYGPKTEDAVRRFQKVYLPRAVDGVYGPATKAKLAEVLR